MNANDVETGALFTNHRPGHRHAITDQGTRAGITTVAVVVIVVILVAAIGFVSLIPQKSNCGSGGCVTTEAGLSTTTYSTTTGLIMPHTTNATTAQWNTAQVVGLVLTSSTVLSYVANAYSYEIATWESGPSDLNMGTVVVNVTGSLVVQGNWTTGYDLTYTGIRTLNATVQFTPPSTYVLEGVTVANRPDINQSIAFTTQQQQVIGVAVSNSTVRGLLGPGPFYVAYVTPVPMTNGTYQSDFFAYLYQANGTRTVGVFVNSGITAVVKAYTDTRVDTECFGDNPSSPDCFSSPWNSTS